MLVSGSVIVPDRSRRMYLLRELCGFRLRENPRNQRHEVYDVSHRRDLYGKPLGLTDSKMISSAIKSQHLFV